MENLTIEQAFNNIQAAIEMFRGTKQEHIILEQSLDKISTLFRGKVKDKESLPKNSETIFNAKVTEVN